MSPIREPSLFLSSTCYDLSQLRTDLREFISSLGMRPVLSEDPSFPVNPDLNTVENSLRAVEDDADIFVLVIGGRYGSVNEEGRSITNLEYLRADAKGIPIYVFVHKPIIDTLSVWRDNPEGNFKSVVDSPKLFEFVDSIRQGKKEWVYPFDKAQDIEQILRQQLAYLFMDALEYRGKVKATDLPPAVAALEGEPLRLVLERPTAWPALLFSAVLSEELRVSADLKRDMQYRVDFREGVHLPEVTGVSSFTNYLFAQLHSLQRVSSGLDRLFESAVQEASGKDDSTGDPETVIYSARKVREAHRRAIEWTLDIQRIVVDRYQKARDLASELSRNMIGEIEDFDKALHEELDEKIPLAEAGQSVTLRLTLTLTLPDMDPLLREIERLFQQES